MSKPEVIQNVANICQILSLPMAFILSPFMAAHLQKLRKWWVTGVFVALFVASFVVKAIINDDVESKAWKDTPPTIMVLNQTFMNEEVVLDDHSYRDCKFQNVTVAFNGMRPFHLINCQFVGGAKIKTPKAEMNVFAMLLSQMGLIQTNVVVISSNR